MELNQFIRIESYGRSSPKKAKSGFCQNINDVINEAKRDLDSIPHVKDPKPPVYLHGRPLDELPMVCEEWASSMTDAKGRALRKDALCLVAGVVSAPAGMEQWQAFRDESVEWLKRKYGDSLVSVVEHVDEDNPHIHFYVIPRPGQRFETIHEGRAASDAVQGKNMKASKEVAYDAAMTGFQDRFHADVAARFDFNRIGPAAPRVSRAEAVKRKEVRKAVEANMMREVKTAIARGEARGVQQGRQKGFAVGVDEGKAEFEKKNLFAKLADFIAGLKKQNSELTAALEKAAKEAGSFRQKFIDLKEKGGELLAELKKLRPEVDKLRANNAALQKENAVLQKSLANQGKLESELSRAKSKLAVQEIEIDMYKAEEQKRLDAEREAQRIAKLSKRVISKDGLAYD